MDEPPLKAVTPLKFRRKRSRPGNLTATLSIRDMPEVLALMQKDVCREVAGYLRDVAAQETPLVATRLRQVADAIDGTKPQ